MVMVMVLVMVLVMVMVMVMVKVMVMVMDCKVWGHTVLEGIHHNRGTGVRVVLWT